MMDQAEAGTVAVWMSQQTLTDEMRRNVTVGMTDLSHTGTLWDNDDNWDDKT